MIWTGFQLGVGLFLGFLLCSFVYRYFTRAIGGVGRLLRMGIAAFDWCVGIVLVPFSYIFDKLPHASEEGNPIGWKR